MHPRDAELLGDARRMQRRRTAERDQRVLADHLAALDRVHARRTRHVLADDLVHGIGRGFRRQAERLADRAQQRLARKLRIELRSCRPQRPPGSIMPSATSASVTVGRWPPRP